MRNNQAILHRAHIIRRIIILYISYAQKGYTSVSFVYMIGEVRRQQYKCTNTIEGGRIAILIGFFILFVDDILGRDMWYTSFIISQTLYSQNSFSLLLIPHYPIIYNLQHSPTTFIFYTQNY